MPRKKKEDTIEEAIKTELEKGVDDTEEKRTETAKKADAATANHGHTEEAPLDEETRYRRIAMNFYGTCFNYLAGMYAIMQEMVEALKHISERVDNIEKEAVGEVKHKHD